jgi:hypothetical protein
MSFGIKQIQQEYGVMFQKEHRPVINGVDYPIQLLIIGM